MLHPPPRPDRFIRSFTHGLMAPLAALSALLATKTDATMFGATEFQVRDLVHAIGAKAIPAAVDAQKKRATTAAPDPAPPAANRPSSIAGKVAGS